ncbi:Divalent metal cation (Fe/Co/Zn/Cd) efflux pump (FieF) (PDB:2QFI) [Commensalibacter communis]|uniref:cation diffusion facilitator family transporter n=1 Tax=Commensalibacter communis TaxID=2972786 RepID=UPI0022FF6AAA|nr:cation diffusion facilitator family transporter [Commensalibacter communis]CAI3951658.1 Divalent metal cation (Fe/Co/Zn/Cd) efflux pump (FieF) (PDB:2QFI) [Commensalibacter communis]
MIVKVIQNKKILFSIGSIFISILVFTLKYIAWYTTNSVAFYSDMLETLINVAAAILGCVALIFASRPADQQHPYGHHKAEYISAAIEGLLVLTTAALILYESVEAWQHPKLPTAPFIGILFNGSAGIVNLFWCIILIKVGRKYCSPALIAGGEHILSDVWTTVGLICGFILIPLFQWSLLDAILGFCIAINVLRVGLHVIVDSFNGLMDQAPPKQVTEHIYEIIKANATEALEFHMVRFRQVGAMTFIDFHLVVPGTMNVYKAHEICDKIEMALRKAVGSISVNIHVEPENEAKITIPK